MGGAGGRGVKVVTECACSIDVEIPDIGDYDEFADDFTVFSNARSTTAWKCDECKRNIKAQEPHELAQWFKHGKAVENHRSCEDCLSLRETYFCTSIFGQLWLDMEMEIEEEGTEHLIDSRMAKLTKFAREKLCEMIEKYWEEED